MQEKRKRAKKRKRTAKSILGAGIAAIILYLSTLGISIFGGGSLSSDLREHDIVDVPAEAIEQVLNIEDDDTTKSMPEEVVIVVREENIYYGDNEITVEDLAQIISDNSAEEVTLEDDGAKRVTYAKVFDELEKLGVIIDEK